MKKGIDDEDINKHDKRASQHHKSTKKTHIVNIGL